MPSSLPQQRPRQQPGSACDECRRRKLRCDRKQPQCGACANSDATCVMRHSRPRRGPKKGHLRALRSQIAELETRLNEHEKGNPDKLDYLDESVCTPNSENSINESSEFGGNELRNAYTSPNDLAPNYSNLPFWSVPLANSVPQLVSLDAVENLHTNIVSPTLDGVPVGMHLNSYVCSDLDQLYFDRVHAFAPMLQRFRYQSWSGEMHKSKARVCLQYAMWTLAAASSSQYQSIRTGLYTEARRWLYALEMDSQEIVPSSIEQVQAWILLSLYEFVNDDYQRGLLSAGRAFRLVQLKRLHEVDGRPATIWQGDWIDLETDRRTFWVAYTIDRFTSLNNSVPLTFNEQEIRTRLPAPDDHFASGRSVQMAFLSEMMAANELTPSGACPFIEAIYMATICGRTLAHKHKPNIEQCYEDTMAEFRLRHRPLNTLLSASIERLSALTISTSENSGPSMLLFVALTAYMAVFVLYELIQSVPLGTEEGSRALLLEYKHRALNASQELGMLTSMLTHLNHFQSYPFTPIPLSGTTKFRMAHSAFSDAHSAIMPDMATALFGLDNINIDNLSHELSLASGTACG